MKRFFTFLALLCLALPCMAGTMTQTLLVISSTPTAGMTITIGGGARTFANPTTPSPSTLILTPSSIADAQSKIYDHLTTFRALGLQQVLKSNANALIILAQPDVSLGIATTGGWASLGTTTFSTDPGTVLRVPPSVTSDVAIRTNIWTLALQAIRDNSQDSFSALCPAMANFVSLGVDQTIASVKNFSSGQILTNAGNLLAGTLSNSVMYQMSLQQVAGAANTNHGLYFKDSSAGYHSVLLPDANGVPSIYTVTGVAVAPSGAFHFSPLPENLLNGYAGDISYGRLAAVPNEWLGTNHFAQITNTPIVNGTISGSALTLNSYSVTVGALTNGFLANVGSTNMNATNLISKGTADFSPGALKVSGMYATAEANLKGYLLIGATNIGVFGLPPGFTSGLILRLSTDLTADPPAQDGVLWTDAFGQLRYRSWGGDGSGANNWLSNIAWQFDASNSDQTLSTTYSALTFNTTGFYGLGMGAGIKVETAGTWLLKASVGIDADATTGNDDIYAQFFSLGAGAALTGSERQKSNIPAGKHDQIELTTVYVATASDVVEVYVKNNTSARGKVSPSKTHMFAVRVK